MGLKTRPTEKLQDGQRAQIRAWAAARYPFLSRQALADEWEKCRDWHLSRGIQRACWEATFRNWLRKAAEISGRDSVLKRNPDGQLLPLLRIIQGGD